MRVYLDGTFDLLHYGHTRAMRQARSIGSSLIVGVYADELGSRCVLTQDERRELLESVRHVDGVMTGVPRVPDAAFVDVLKDIHGVGLIASEVPEFDPAALSEEKPDPYEHPKALNMFWAIQRTPGISATLLKKHKLTVPLPSCPLRIYVPEWDPRPNTVFVDGAFDCLHIGHITFLREARRYGKHVVVGLHAEDTVRDRRGTVPVLCMADRARALMDCKYVDGVILDTPPVLTSDFLKHVGASRVARGAIHETCTPDRNRYKRVASSLVYILSPSTVTLHDLRRRLVCIQLEEASGVSKSSYKPSTMVHASSGDGGSGT